MTQSSCISACLACAFDNTTLVFCIRHPPNLFSEGWTDLSVTLCALLKCPTASHWSADTTKAPLLTHHRSFTFIFPHHFSRAFAVIGKFLQVSGPTTTWEHELLPAELPSATRAFPTAADSSTNSSVSHQSRCPGDKTADAFFNHPPSPLTAQSSGVRHRNLNLKRDSLHFLLSLMSRAGRQHSGESEDIWESSGESCSRTEKEETDAWVHVIDMRSIEPNRTHKETTSPLKTILHVTSSSWAKFEKQHWLNLLLFFPLKFSQNSLLTG